jgi:hypothetical protein
MYETVRSICDITEHIIRRTGTYLSIQASIFQEVTEWKFSFGIEYKMAQKNLQTFQILNI